MNQNSRKDFIFLAVISIIHVVFFGLALHYKRIFNGDSFEYILEAINIKDHCLFYSGNTALPIEDEYKTLRTPGYPLFLLLTYLFSINNWIVLALQNVISVFNIFYTREILITLGYNRKYDWLLLTLLTFFPSQFIYANTIAPDLLLQTFVLIYFGNTINFLRTGDQRSLIWMSIALVIGLFVKPVLYPYAFIHLIVLAVYLAYRKLTSLTSVSMIAIPVLCILAFNSWNYFRTDKYHFTSIQSFNALYYYHNFHQDKLGREAGEEFLKVERNRIADLTSFRERYDYAQERGLGLLKQDLLPYLTYHLKMSARFFMETGKGEMDLFLGKTTLGNLYAGNTKGLKQVFTEEGVQGLLHYTKDQPSVPLALLTFFFNILRTVGLLMFVIYFREHRLIKWFIVLFILYFALITGPISNAHYVLPVSLIMMGCACIGYHRLLTARNNKAIITS